MSTELSAGLEAQECGTEGALLVEFMNGSSGISRNIAWDCGVSASEGSPARTVVMVQMALVYGWVSPAPSPGKPRGASSSLLSWALAPGPQGGLGWSCPVKSSGSKDIVTVATAQFPSWII